MFSRMGGKIHKKYFHKKDLHPLRTDKFPRKTFFNMFHKNKFGRKILSGLFREMKIPEKKHFPEN